MAFAWYDVLLILALSAEVVALLVTVVGYFFSKPQIEELPCNAKWINDLVKKIWNQNLRPFADGGAKNLVNQLLANRGMKWISLAKIDVGPEPPRIAFVDVQTANSAEKGNTVTALVDFRIKLSPNIELMLYELRIFSLLEINLSFNLVTQLKFPKEAISTSEIEFNISARKIHLKNYALGGIGRIFNTGIFKSTIIKMTNVFLP